MKFVAHYFWNPAKRGAQRKHGMPQNVAECLGEDRLLRSEGTHAPGTVRRRLSSWATLHRRRGVEGPFASPALGPALPLAVQASVRPRHRKRRRAFTRDVLDRLLATCASDRLADTRDVAILIVAFAWGGRRRSEAAGLRIEQPREEPSARLDPADGGSMLLPCPAIQLGRGRTAPADEEGRAFLVGPPVETLREWLQRSDITKGPVFRAIDRWGAVADRELTPQSINPIVRRRYAMAAGLDPRDYSAHRLRAGYLAEAARRGIALQEAMQRLQRRSVPRRAITTRSTGRRAGRCA